jgi:hypothetical protein
VDEEVREVASVVCVLVRALLGERTRPNILINVWLSNARSSLIVYVRLFVSRSSSS